MPIEEDIQQLEAGVILDLYTLDLSPLGGGQVYFTPSIEPSGSPAVVFRGISYQPADMLIDGLEVSGQNVLPRPKIKITNTHRVLAAMMQQYQDFVGARVIRLRTFDRYLDGQPEADPNAFFPPDVFVVQQKSAFNKLFVEFTLAAAIDVEGQKLPRRLVLHNYCARRYRVWSDSLNAFDYSKAQCPYTGVLMFDMYDNQITDPHLDRCSKKFTGCVKRFETDPLPGWFFPGAGRFQGNAG